MLINNFIVVAEQVSNSMPKQKNVENYNRLFDPVAFNAFFYTAAKPYFITFANIL